jgi:hypothetical protein
MPTLKTNLCLTLIGDFMTFNEETSGSSEN